MEYTPCAREVVAALNGVCEVDETLWWRRRLLALADLYPTFALAYALFQPTV